MPTAHSTREDRLSIRTSPQQKDLLVQAAHARHMNMSQFVLQTALDAAQRVLDEERRLTVSAAEYAWLTEAHREKLPACRRRCKRRPSGMIRLDRFCRPLLYTL